MSKYQDKTDEQLIEELRAGDCGIVDYIMDKYKNIVRQKAKAMFLLGGENDDLIQEGMIGLFKSVQDFKLDANTSFRSFAELCISRQMYSAIEASKRKKHIPLNSYISISSNQGLEDNIEYIDAIQDTNSNPETLFIGKEYQEGLENKLSKQLSDLENRVLYLHLRGVDYKSIAMLLDKTPKVVDNALQRIKGKANKIVMELQ